MRFWLIVLCLFPGQWLFGQWPRETELPETGRLYIHFEKPVAWNGNLDWDSERNIPGIEAIRPAFPMAGLDQIAEGRFAPGMEPEAMEAILRSQPGIARVEPVPWVHSSFVPDDLDSVRDYYLPLIGAPQAWDSTRGDSGIVVAVVDNAIQVQHEDLRQVIWQNPREISGDGIDNDGNGWIDDTRGWDVGDGDADPSPSGRAFRHGTHIAGLIAATADNGRGSVGVAHGCRILPVKVAKDAGFADSYPLSDALRGVAYAMSVRVPIICMAWGGTDSVYAAHLLMERARERGTILVAAAGNGPGDTNPATTDSTLEYPASYRAVISVAATDETDKKAGFSTANRRVSLCAPGNLLYAPVPSVTLQSSYTQLRGSSQATAVASGAFALLLSYKPCLDPQQAEAVLRASCVPLDGMNPDYAGRLGSGRINIADALASVGSPGNGVASWGIPDTITCTGVIQPFYSGGGCPDSLVWVGPQGETRRGWRPSFWVDSSGTYQLCLYVWKGGMVDSLCRNIPVHYGASIKAFPGDTAIMAGDSIRLSVEGASGLYIWEPANVFRSLALGREPWAYPEDSTLVRVYWRGAHGCQLADSFLIAVSPPSGLHKGIRAGFLVYPQPARAGVFIRHNLKGLIHISLWDLAGRQLGSWVQAPDETVWLDRPSGIKAGTYLLRFSTSDGQFFKKVMFY